MGFLLGLLTFFLVLATLILVHELGHFSVAKLMRVRVEEFGLGFPPRVKSWRHGGTLYSLNAIPVGGFVKMLGENGEDADPDSFGSKAPWQRLLILVAGPAMNLLLAVAVFFFVSLHGTPRGLTIITGVAPGSPAAQVGLQRGDRIVSVDGQAVHYYEDVAAAIGKHLGQRVELNVQRGNQIVPVTLVPRRHPPADQGAMGVMLQDTTIVSYGPNQAGRQAVSDVGAMATSLPMIVQAISQHGADSVQGPIGIARITTSVVQNAPHQGGVDSVLQLVAILSANLGVLNLLPIPALDGGRIVFVLISWLRRRNLDPELEGLIHMAGMAALLLLIVVISYHDVLRWVTGGSF